MGKSKTFTAFGADALQALELGLEMLRANLLATHAHEPIEWDGGDGTGFMIDQAF